MYGLLGLLPTSGENVMSTSPLETDLLRKMVTCSILILPAVCVYIYIYIYKIFFYVMCVLYCPKYSSNTACKVLTSVSHCTVHGTNN